MKELSLFTGAGGGVYASLLLDHQLVGYVEKNEYCQKVIKQRIKDGIFHDAPIFGDIREFDGKSFNGKVDIISAGFPCQPFSVAGKKKAAKDDRNMWPETIRIINEVKPKEVFLENVPGLLSSGYFGVILKDLSEAGYDAKWITLSASECGAPHKRERLWILANARFQRCSPRTSEEIQLQSQKPIWKNLNNICGDVSDTKSKRLEGHGINRGDDTKFAETRFSRASVDSLSSSWWEFEPDVGRVANGVANRKHRIESLGNGQVSVVAATAYKMLTAD